MPHPRPEPSTRPSAGLLVCLLAALAALTALPAAAETSPYYIGVSQSFGYESNLYRIADQQSLPPDLSRSDKLSITSLIGGVDQTFGRQRLYGSLNLGANRFARNKDLNNESYGLKLAVDWATEGRLWGTFSASADQELTKFNNLQGINDTVETQKNIARVEEAEAVFRLGRTTRLTLEAGLGYRQRSYSLPSYDDNEFHEPAASLGLRFRMNSTLILGAGIRHAEAEFPRYKQTGVDTYEPDTRSRQDLHFTAWWEPSDISQVYLRLGPTRSWYEHNKASDFSGITGSATWAWRVTGKTKIDTVLSRDLGQGSDAVTLGINTAGVVDNSKVTTALKLQAEHELTGKVALTASLVYAHRLLTKTETIPITNVSTTLEGYDNTTTAQLGARWSVTRSGQLGCNIHNERRSSGNLLLSTPFDGYGFSCYGQIVLQ